MGSGVSHGNFPLAHTSFPLLFAVIMESLFPESIRKSLIVDFVSMIAC